MRSIIKESYDPRAVSLTATQKGILAILHNSPTPQAAYDAINGNPTLVTSRNVLVRLGLISIVGNQAMLTQGGQQAVAANNLADETGQMTEEGTALIDQINATRPNYKVAEGFELLKKLITD
jgi:hypothetical protein